MEVQKLKVTLKQVYDIIDDDEFNDFNYNGDQLGKDRKNISNLNSKEVFIEDVGLWEHNWEDKIIPQEFYKHLRADFQISNTNV